MLTWAALMCVAQQSAPTSLTGHAWARIGSELYVVGGMGSVNRGRYFQTLWKVDPVRSRWTEMGEMKVARGMAAAAALGGSIYVAGGFPWSGEHLKSVERFDLKTKRWSNVAPMHTARSRFQLVAMGGALYAVAGMRGASTGPLNTPLVEAYDPKSDQWRPAGSLLHARHGFAAIAWKGRIYVFGGNDASSATSAECWNPETGKSEELPPMQVKRGFHGVVEVNGLLCNFGGRPAGRHPSAYDIARRRWDDLPAADIECNRFAYAQIDKTIWLVGGESLEQDHPGVHAGRHGLDGGSRRCT